MGHMSLVYKTASAEKETSLVHINTLLAHGLMGCMMF